VDQGGKFWVVGFGIADLTKVLYLKLLVHLFSFQKEMAPFVSSLELEFARHHQPMIGKQ
jgi:hypothetical protein